MKRFILVLLVIMALFGQEGCAVFMAARQPVKKDLSLFKVGTPRSSLIAEFGSPVTSDTRDGKKYEIFKFTQGYSGPAKVGRAFFHGAADVVTLGAWEVVGTPTEMVFDGTEMAYEVSYDENNCVNGITLLKQGGSKNTDKGDKDDKRNNLDEKG